MQKQNIIFVHGGQGCGKSTVTNLMREKMLHTVLIRLAGVPSNVENQNQKAYQYHLAMMESAYFSAHSGMNFVFDRSFLCEKVYANLGFKAHSFESETHRLNQFLTTLSFKYKVHFVLLTASEETLTQRLNREDKPQFEQVKYNATNSLRQQEEYLKEFANLPSEVKWLVLKTDELTPQEVAENIINWMKED